VSQLGPLIGCDLVDMAGEGDDLEFLETPAGDCASGWAQSGAMGTDGAHSGSSLELTFLKGDRKGLLMLV